MRNLVLALSVGMVSLLVGGTAVALVGITLIAPLAAVFLVPHRRDSLPLRG